MQEERGLGAVCVEVGGVGDKGVPDFRREGVGVARADEKFAEVGEADLVDRGPQRGVIAEMGIDEQEAFPTGGRRPCRELTQGGEKGLVKNGEGAGPFRGVAGGDRVSERGCDRNAGLCGRISARGGGEQRVGLDRKVRPVLFRGAERDEQQGRRFFPSCSAISGHASVSRKTGAPPADLRMRSSVEAASIG